MRIFRLGKDPIDFVQVYGERNSGTTYLGKLLQDNLRIPTNLLGMPASDETPHGPGIFGYKHWFPDPGKLADPRQAQTLFVVVYRNPYTWLRAMIDRPYALERSLRGKAIADLPGVKLAGHINGRDTKNEFDPETGEMLTIFELRARKIAHFEKLRTRVHNVAYLNLEALVADPGAVMGELADAFGTAFRAPLALDRAPYRHLADEIRSPARFDAAEAAVLDHSFDWEAERTIGYGRGAYGLAPKPRVTMTILHGGSSVGKSHLMAEIVAAGEGLEALEMDDCAYWEPRKPQLDAASLRALLPGLSENDADELRKLAASEKPKARLCIEFLLKRLAEFTAAGTPRRVVATCGALPDPAAAGQRSLYRFLEARLQVEFLHLLIDVDPQVHKARIDKRGRSHLAQDIVRLHARKSARRDHYDAVVTGFADAYPVISGATGALPAASVRRSPTDWRESGPRSSAGTPRVRIVRSGPTYVQVYGERNSGTKYLTQLIREAARAPDNVLGAYASRSDPVNRARMIGYKHYYPRPEKLALHQHETLFVVIYKNPYTWIRSMLGKPYHFRECLDGRAIADLPGIRLAGHDIHGREIPDVHPETGERITLFELRKFKILAWEALADQVENVAYVNYEDLLVSPSETMQAIIDAFGGFFAEGTAPRHEPDPKFVAKYVSPAPFDPADMAVMDAHIDWEAEALAGYERGNLFVPGRGAATRDAATDAATG